MAHFAEINSDGLVLRVLVVPDSEEHRGQEYLSEDIGLGGTWLQASYNTHANVHAEGKEPLRYNFPGTGFYYIAEKDAFVAPQPYPSWSIDWETGSWAPPVPHPDDDGIYIWDEDQQAWVEAAE